ncbi:unnamed protein product [Calypogeia fissa]
MVATRLTATPSPIKPTNGAEDESNKSPLGASQHRPPVQVPEKDAIRTVQNIKELPRRWVSWRKLLCNTKPAEQGAIKRAITGPGWKTAPFIFGGEFGERTGSFGLQMNLVNFLIFEMNLSLATSANIVTNFFGSTCMATLAGAFLADAYFGRFMTITAGCLFYLAGLIVFTMSASISSLRPAPCTEIQRFMGTCEKTSSLQIGVLYISLVLQCLGSGGVKPCVAVFGADQFEDSTKRPEEDQVRHYFNWYYMTVTMAMVTSLALIVYIQDSVSWGWGGAVCAILMALGTVVFLLGARFYRSGPPSGSPLTSMVQVLVAAVRKHKYTLPENPDHLHEARKYQDKQSLEGAEQEVLSHTDNFRFLDKAAILEESDEEPDMRRRLHPWRLTTVHQVEELKILLRLGPVWLCTVVVSTAIVQAGTFTVQQALVMDRHIGKLVLPPASMTIFSIIALVVFIPFYDLVLIKLLRRITGQPKGLSYLQRIGVGTFLNIFTMVAAALVEKRRKLHETGIMLDDQLKLPMSAFWLVPQYLLAGLTESFVAIGELEFFYDEAPHSIRSMSSAFLWASWGVGSFLSSAFVSLIQSATMSHGRGGWLQDDINRGHLDRFYWFLAALSLLNLVVFCYISRWYVYKNTNIYDYDSSESDDQNLGDLAAKKGGGGEA